MAIFKTCCCCCRVKSGCLVAAIFFMAISSVDLANQVNSLKEGFEPILCSSAVSDAVMIIMSLLLMLGVLMANKWLCLAWIAYAVVFMATGTVLAILHVATEAVKLEYVIASLQHYDNGNGTTYNFDALRQSTAMELAILMAVYVVAAVPMAILILVVVSHYQNLRDGVEDEESLPMPYEMTEYNGLSKQRRKQERLLRDDPFPLTGHRSGRGYSRPRPEPPRSIMLRPDVHTPADPTLEVCTTVGRDTTAEVTTGRGLTLEVPGSTAKTPEVGSAENTPSEAQTPRSHQSEGAHTCTEVIVLTNAEAKTVPDPEPEVDSSEEPSPDVTSACVPTCTPKCLRQEALLPNQPEHTDAAD